MRKSLIHLWWVVIALPVSGFEGQQTPAPKEQAPTEAAIRNWVRQLGDDSFEVRETASRGLVNAGPHAMPVVLEAAKNTDAEVRDRAKRITRQIEARAAARFEALGAHLSYDSATRAVRCVSFDRSSGADQVKAARVIDADILDLRALPNLEGLWLNGTKISDDGLRHVGTMKGLQYLDLSGTRVTDAGLVHLGGMVKLETLYISNTAMTGRGLAHLTKLQSLTDLQLFQSRVDDLGLAAGVTGLKGLKKLRGFSLDYTQVTDAGLAHLKALPDLTWLGLTNTRITDAGLVHLKGLPKLEKLILKSTKVTDAGLVHLKALPKLQGISLDSTKVTDAGILHLLALKGLEYIDLGHTATTISGLKQLKALPRLNSLGYRREDFTDQQYQELNDALPGIGIMP